jgi:hypothetical protein
MNSFFSASLHLCVFAFSLFIALHKLGANAEESVGLIAR